MKAEKQRLSGPTIVDVIVSCLIPFWGLIVGIIALIKGEFRRSAWMVGISCALLGLLVAVSMHS